ncbi:MAG: SDR family oxidoreductase [Balneolaceae bacterium]|nr:SDR family oxidoreductase [Balneolaceae bacterium]
MDNFVTGRWALVTGASSGLGVDFARELASRGCNIILVARREQRLIAVREQLTKDFGVECEIIVKDLVPRQASVELYAEVKNLGLDVDILVNNAGFGLFGEFLDIDWDREREMLQLDMISLTHLTKLFAKEMSRRNFGYILQISSIGAYQPTPTYATYAAAKSYVLHFGEALNYELRDTDVSCTVLSPGVTATEFLEVSGQKPSLYQRLVMMESRDVARTGVEAMIKRRSSVVPGWMNKLAVFTIRFIPRRMAAALGNFLMTSGQR